MNEAALTLEGWYALHDFRSIDWKAWKSLDREQREAALAQFTKMWEQWRSCEEEGTGTTVVYTVNGHKADFSSFICANGWRPSTNWKPSWTSPARRMLDPTVLLRFRRGVKQLFGQTRFRSDGKSGSARAAQTDSARDRAHLLLPDEQTPRRQ